LPASDEVALPLLSYRRGIIDGFAVVYSMQSGVIIDATPIFSSQ